MGLDENALTCSSDNSNTTHLHNNLAPIKKKVKEEFWKAKPFLQKGLRDCILGLPISKKKCVGV